MPSKPTLFGCASPNAVGVSAKYSDASGGGPGVGRPPTFMCSILWIIRMDSLWCGSMPSDPPGESSGDSSGSGAARGCFLAPYSPSSPSSSSYASSPPRCGDDLLAKYSSSEEFRIAFCRMVNALSMSLL
eukprot:30854-Pelagococcus_subviridis.AAC.6